MTNAGGDAGMMANVDEDAAKMTNANRDAVKMETVMEVQNLCLWMLGMRERP